MREHAIRRSLKAKTLHKLALRPAGADDVVVLPSERRCCETLEQGRKRVYAEFLPIGQGPLRHAKEAALPA